MVAEIAWASPKNIICPPRRDTTEVSLLPCKTHLLILIHYLQILLELYLHKHFIANKGNFLSVFSDLYTFYFFFTDWFLHCPISDSIILLSLLSLQSLDTIILKKGLYNDADSTKITKKGWKGRSGG